MSILSAIAVYFLIWWTILFAILPLGIRGQHETDEVIPGSDPGAPSQPFLKKKALQTSIAAFAIWLVVFLCVQFKLVDFGNLPFLPDFTPQTG